MSELDRALNLLSKGEKSNSSPVDISFQEYIMGLIKGNSCDTIKVRCEIAQVIVIMIYASSTKYVLFDNISELEYEEFCRDDLHIDINEKFNCSRTINVDGVQTRIYCNMKPLTNLPVITISTTKIPPESLFKQTIPSELFDKIVHSNFLIAGASGSGKTYLVNYLLNKYIRDDENIALIQEFGELIPPNILTTSLIVPPPKPNEKHLLKFVTEQSNLMRLDAVYVGEIKGEEAWPFVVNLASGTRGGATIHGETAQKALARLRALCQLSCDNNEVIDQFISHSIQYIIVMEKKNIKQIHKLIGTSNRGIFASEEISS